MPPWVAPASLPARILSAVLHPASRGSSAPSPLHIKDSTRIVLRDVLMFRSMFEGSHSHLFGEILQHMISDIKHSKFCRTNHPIFLLPFNSHYCATGHDKKGNRDVLRCRCWVARWVHTQARIFGIGLSPLIWGHTEKGQGALRSFQN